MITDDIYKKVLIEPVRNGANKLIIISGYASSAMAFHHLEELKELGVNIEISLLVGMCPTDGISLSNHRGFKNIMNVDYIGSFSCSYICKTPAVHSKIYIWFKEDKFYKSFIGSANYSQNAFFLKQREILTEINDEKIVDYYHLLEKDSIYCNHSETEEVVKIYSNNNYYRKSNKTHNALKEDNEIIQNNNYLEKRTVSLVTKSGNIQNRAGLNWGQRKGRNPNQAYIQLSPKIYHSDFFPIKPQHFTVITDDSKTFICTRAQKGNEGQAIQTPHNNSLLGEYFRHRLGIKSGAFITKRKLEEYGRTDIEFFKFDNENYYMDFSVDKI